MLNNNTPVFLKINLLFPFTMKLLGRASRIMVCLCFSSSHGRQSPASIGRQPSFSVVRPEVLVVVDSKLGKHKVATTKYITNFWTADNSKFQTITSPRVVYRKYPGHKQTLLILRTARSNTICLMASKPLG